MASRKKIFKVRKKLKRLKAGKKRKNYLNIHGSTPNKATFFGDSVVDQ